jgi:outer membrane receptor protein involved in Fe transport
MVRHIHLNNGFVYIALFFALIFLCSGEEIQAGTTGKISGQITDKSTGEALPYANVLLVGTDRGASTDKDGYYVIINVPPSKYDISVRYIGYATTSVNGVNVSVDRTSKQNIELTPQSFEGEEVSIVAERPAVQMDRTHTAAIVNTETVELMPVTELSEIIELQSGVVSSGGELHFRGGRGREVAYLIDGIPVQNSYSQSGGNNVAVENSMIQELEVISGTFNAEYGSAQSGVVNIVTKRPAKEFSGSFKTYAGEWFSNKDDTYLGVSNINPLAEKDFNFSLSGPLWSNKLGFFVNARYNSWESLGWYERRYNTIDGWKISAYERWFEEHNLDEAQSSLAINIPDSLKTGDGSQGPLSSGYNSSFSSKISYFPSPTMSFNYQLFANYNRSEGAGSDKRYQPDDFNTSKSWSQHHFFTFRHFPKENFFYNMTFSYQYNDGESYYSKNNDMALYPGDDGIQLFGASSNGFSLGGTPGFYSDAEGKNYRKQYLFSGDFNWQADKYNFVKLGFIIKKHDINTYSWGVRSTQVWDNTQWPNRDVINPAEFEFGEYWDMLGEYWANWETLFGEDRYVAHADSEYTLWRDYDLNPLEGALYLQDKIELGEIIINGGVRLDMFQPNEQYPIELRTEAFNIGDASNLADASVKYQLSPRFGLSFPISATGAFHAAYGHFFQMPSFQHMYNNPLYTMTPLQLEGRRLGNADLKAEKTIAYEIGLQQELTPTIVADITAYYKDFRNLLGIEMVTTIDAIGYTRYINRDYGNTKGITLGLTKSGGMITGGANYTFAYANGSSSDPNALYLIQSATRIGGTPDQFAERKILPLDWDQRHTMNAYINLSKSNNWSIGFVGRLESGLPYSPTFVERFDIAEREYRNLGIKPFKWWVDFKAKKRLKLGGLDTSLFFKVDNLFDSLNQLSVFSSTGTADYNARLPENQKLLLQTLAQEGHFTVHEVDVRPGFYSSPRKVQLGWEFYF